MKKLNKLQINIDNLMKEKELIALRGGYGVHITCQRDYGSCSYPNGYTCESWYVHSICDSICPGWKSAICAG